MKIFRQSSGHHFSAIIMEEGDYTMNPNYVKGEHVDFIFIPESEEQYYTVESPLYNQLISNISIAGNYFGKILTYKTLTYELQGNS